MVNCIWVGTILDIIKDKEDAEKVLNEILDISTTSITKTSIDKGIHLVHFSVEDKDIPRMAITRLRTDDIKWEDDYLRNKRRIKR